jgi:penicillin-binding protein 2
MRPHLTLKDHFRETKLFNARAITAVIVAALLIVLIIARLIYLQIVDHELYSTLSEDNRFHIRAIPPTRGLIYDRNGILLAQNFPTYALEITPEQVKNMDETLKALSKLVTIDESDMTRFKRELKRNRPFKAIPIRTRLSDEEVARIAVNRYRFPGVDIAAELIRHYPHGGLGVHAIGYVGRINEKESQLVDESDYDGTDYIGKTGVEKYYEKILHGHVGVAQEETNATGRRLRVIEQVPAEPGINLHLTLDAKLQQVAEEAMGKRRGAVVAIDPNNGNILVLASTPVYDPNLFVTGIDRKTYQELRNSEDLPLFNRALRGRYPPGSTIKPFVGLAGLELGVIKSDTTTFCPGWYRLPGDRHRYRDWKKQGHGTVDLDTAIVQSCDVYFYNLAHELGIDRLAGYLFPFGFNYKTGADIFGELPGLMPTSQWKRKSRGQPWYAGETLITGIGQGYTLITPLQMAHSVATLATYGRNMQPRIVGALENTNTGITKEIYPIEETPVPVKNKENWDKVIHAMERVVHYWHGTAYHSIGKDAPYKIGGKTGTAQVIGVKQGETYKADSVDERLRDHALFIAFAPVDNPKIAVAVVVENGGHGGSAAAPVARKVMDYYLLTEEKINIDKNSP